MQCRYLKTVETRCRGFAVAGSDYCWRHSPDVDEGKKKSASALGGYNRRAYMPVKLPDIKLKTMSDIPPMLVETLRCLRRGEMDLRLGTAIGYLTNVLMKSYELADLEHRVESVENYIKGNLKGELTDDYDIADTKAKK